MWPTPEDGLKFYLLKCTQYIMKNELIVMIALYHQIKVKREDLIERFI